MARKFRELLEKMPPEARAESARLADRHRRHRTTQPLLSPRFEDTDTAAQQVANALAQ